MNSVLTPEVAALGMTLSPVGGALAVVVLHRIFSSSPRVLRAITGGGQAVSAALMSITALLVVLEFYEREHHHEAMNEVPPPPIRFFPCAILSLSIGCGIHIFHMLESMGQGPGIALAISLFVHAIAEGSAAGVAYGSANFTPIALSIILHNIPEGIVIALASYPKDAGALRVLFFAAASHVGQSLAVVAVAGASSGELGLPREAAIVLEGVSVGTILAACACELLPGATETIGSQRAWVVAISTFVACIAFLFK